MGRGSRHSSGRSSRDRHRNLAVQAAAEPLGVASFGLNAFAHKSRSFRTARIFSKPRAVSLGPRVGAEKPVGWAMNSLPRAMAPRWPKQMSIALTGPAGDL